MKRTAPQPLSVRRELFKRAVEELCHSHNRLIGAVAALECVAIDTHDWRRDANRAAQVVSRMAAAIQQRAIALQGIDDADELLGPDKYEPAANQEAHNGK